MSCFNPKSPGPLFPRHTALLVFSVKRSLPAHYICCLLEPMKQNFVMLHHFRQKDV